MTETKTMNEDEYSETLSASVVSDLKAKEPSDDEKERLREQHTGHLVRHTTSKLTVKPDVVEGVQAEATAEVPDTYCFTCEEWVGLSGVDLRGTPRSRTDAFYLGGMPTEVREAKNTTASKLNDLAYRLRRDVEHIQTNADAFEFISTELEQLQNLADIDRVEEN